jgi:hypothetical protein
MNDAMRNTRLRGAGSVTATIVQHLCAFVDLAVGIAVARRALSQNRRRAFVISATGVRALARRYSFSRTMLESGAPEPTTATFSGTTSPRRS